VITSLLSLVWDQAIQLLDTQAPHHCNILFYTLVSRLIAQTIGIKVRSIMRVVIDDAAAIVGIS